MRVGPKSKEREICIERHRHTHRQVGHVKTKAEIGKMQLQAKKCQDLGEPPDARKRQGRILPKSLQREHGPADTLILD